MNETQPTLSFPTDTTSPVTIVPIFYMHSGSQRFCTNPQCRCNAQEKGIRAILDQLLDGSLHLRKTDGVSVKGGI
jgi:hypothetical protein